MPVVEFMIVSGRGRLNSQELRAKVYLTFSQNDLIQLNLTQDYV